MAKKWKDLYWGSLISVDSTEYIIYIQKYLEEEEVVEIKEMRFSADAPVVIEWNEVDKLEPVQSSSMTLKVVSETDREYVGLYSVEPGEIRAKILKKNRPSNIMYWSGTLDTELYEEPYAYKDHYEVQFTFSDFAMLDRLRWDKSGLIAIGDIIGHCLSSSKVFYQERKQYISTSVSGMTGNILQKLYVISENFYDEDSAPMTLREVLEETLRPFALRLVQKNGRIHIYDLNSIYAPEIMATEEVWWKSTDQVMGVDKVYNNVSVVFSPYTQTSIVDGTLEHDEMLKTSATSTYKTDTSDSALEGFKLRVGAGENASLPITLGDDARFFRIDSIYSGSDEAGVAWVWGAGTTGYNSVCYPESNREGRQALSGDIMKSSKPIFTVRQGFLTKSSLEATTHQLKVSLDVLMDARYNPFESAGKYNEGNNYKDMTEECNFGYIPIMLYMKDSNGNILYHYENNDVRNSSGYSHDSCKWVEGEGSWGCAWLCYYNKEDRDNGSAFDGWQTNKPIIGQYKGDLPKKWEKMGDGEYIAIPPVGGYLELQVGCGVYQFDYQNRQENENVYRYTRWLLYKNPTITLVDNNGKTEEYKDIEDSSWILSGAEEELPIETIVGTTPSWRTPLNARGCILNENFNAVLDFWRADCHARLERLLINTVYSQYGKRHCTLSGTARIIPDMTLLTDASTNGKYILLSEVQDLLLDTSEIKMCELSEENYEPLESL